MTPPDQNMKEAQEIVNSLKQSRFMVDYDRLLRIPDEFLLEEFIPLITSRPGM